MQDTTVHASSGTGCGAGGIFGFMRADDYAFSRGSAAAFGLLLPDAPGISAKRAALKERETEQGVAIPTGRERMVSPTQ
jgi:hypothetical protein